MKNSLDLGEVLTFYLREPPDGSRSTRVHGGGGVILGKLKGALASPVERGWLTQAQADQIVREQLDKSHMRPVACITAERVESPTQSGTEAPEVELVAFYVHFCLAVCKNGEGFDNRGDTFDRRRGRDIALARLAERQVSTVRTVKDWRRSEPTTYRTRVGMTVPIHQAQLSGPASLHSKVERSILTYVADRDYGFPVPARKLATFWLTF